MLSWGISNPNLHKHDMVPYLCSVHALPESSNLKPFCLCLSVSEPHPQDLHKQLEGRISSFHGTQDTILYPSCFDANAGLFEALLGPKDAVISDELNHASIIDGIRLCKAKRFRWGRARDMSVGLPGLYEARTLGNYRIGKLC